MTLDEYLSLRRQVKDIDPDALRKVETKGPPTEPIDLALRIAFVIISGGMRYTVARTIFDRVRDSLVENGTAEGFGHPQKRRAIERIMRERDSWFQEFLNAQQKGPDVVLQFCETVPHVGEVTKFHLAKNLGVDTMKPDIWLSRIGRSYEEDPRALCERLAREGKDSIAVVDYVLWRAAEQGLWRRSSAES